ncbi:MAG: amino acid adenylation protein [Mastigocladus sp. ERB_26_2]
MSDPYVVTSLEWYVNKYPEIAERCNNALMELIDKQAATTPELVAADSEIDMNGF